MIQFNIFVRRDDVNLELLAFYVQNRGMIIVICAHSGETD